MTTLEGKYTLHCDGGCHRNGSPNSIGGWAYIARSMDLVMACEAGWFRDVSGCPATNNQAEFMAAIEGLNAIPDRSHVQLISDSTTLLNWVKLIQGQVGNGWRTKKTAMNPTLLEGLNAELKRLCVTPLWVRGHNGDEWNEKCDLAAQAQIELGLKADPKERESRGLFDTGNLVKRPQKTRHQSPPKYFNDLVLKIQELEGRMNKLEQSITRTA